MKIVTKIISLLFIILFCTAGMTAASSNTIHQMVIDNNAANNSNNLYIKNSITKLIVNDSQFNSNNSNSSNNFTNSTNSINSTSNYVPLDVENNNNITFQMNTSNVSIINSQNTNNSISINYPAENPANSSIQPTVQINMYNVTITGLQPEQAKTAGVKTILQAEINKSPINDSVKNILPTKQEVREVLITSNAYNYTEIESLVTSEHWYADRYYITFDAEYRHGEVIKHTNDMIMDVIYINQPEGQAGHGRIGVYADQTGLYYIFPEPFAIGKPVIKQSMSCSCNDLTTSVRTAKITWKHLGTESLYPVKTEPASQSVKVVVIKDTSTQPTNTANANTVQSQENSQVVINHFNNVGDTSYITQVFNMFNNWKLKAQNIYINIIGK